MPPLPSSSVERAGVDTSLVQRDVAIRPDGRWDSQPQPTIGRIPLHLPTKEGVAPASPLTGSPEIASA